MAYVYGHIRDDKNEFFYIGVGVNHHTHERSRLIGRNSIWNKIVEKTSYRIEILYDRIEWEDAIELEKSLIKKHGRINIGTGTLANLTDGGEGTIGRIKSDEELEKISGSNNGSWGKSWIKKEGERDKFVSREHLEDYFQDGWKKGRTVSEEVKNKISQKTKGKKLSDEHKKKLGDRSRGHVKSDLERQRRSASLKGRTPWHNVPGFKKMTPEEKIQLKKERGPRSCNVKKHQVPPENI